jgi:hypothetical protein
MDKNRSLIPAPNYELIATSGGDALLSQIRPHWQAKNLITRVKRLLQADPSSACQRIFNASIHDLKEKLILAGVDISSEAARQNKLPPISKSEDIENYSPYNTIELSYRVGLLTKAESRRLFRVYDIRGDLEHEDDEYEASVEDCIYVFKTCIECVLSRDPIEVIKLIDIKKIVEQPTTITISESVIEDFKHAPMVRQLDIHKFLISNALNQSVPDIVRQNCFMTLGTLKPFTHNQVFIDSSQDFIKRIGRSAPDLVHARVAFAAGIFPYLKKTQLTDFFKDFFELMKKTGYAFKSHKAHGELLRNFLEVGGLRFCPKDVKFDILEWLILLYIGELGGYGMGVHRSVFYSNVGAPLALEIIKDSKDVCAEAFAEVQNKSKKIKEAIANQHIARRVESIIDLFESE